MRSSFSVVFTFAFIVTFSKTVEHSDLPLNAWIDNHLISNSMELRSNSISFATRLAITFSQPANDANNIASGSGTFILSSHRRGSSIVIVWFPSLKTDCMFSEDVPLIRTIDLFAIYKLLYLSI
jgi:hypothetical protein